MTNGKTVTLTRWTFVGKVIPVLFNMLSRLLITFLPRSKCLNFMAAITICSDFGAPKIKSDAGVQPRWIQGDSKVGTELASWKKLI